METTYTSMQHPGHMPGAFWKIDDVDKRGKTMNPDVYWLQGLKPLGVYRKTRQSE